MAIEAAGTAAERTLPLFPFERTEMGPAPEYRELRESEPFKKVRLWDGNVAWLVTRYEDVRKLLADNRFSANPRAPGYPNITKLRKVLTGTERPSFIRQDPPDHTKLRRMLTKEFTHHKIQSLRSMIEQIVDDLIEDMLSGRRPVDFVEAFALPLPTQVIMKMLGIPHSDSEFFVERSTTKVRIDVDPQDAIQAGVDMRNFMRDLIAEKSKAPEKHDDILGRMIVDQIQPGHLDIEDAVVSLELLMMAGHETTANMTALGILSLIQNPDDMERLRLNQSDEVVQLAVEEMLRYHTILQFVGTRVATEDVDYNGVMIRSGEGILPMINAANRDPRVFDDPEIFDIARKSTYPHVAFGFGVHQCLGQPLARLELNVVFNKLPKRIPQIRLAVPFDELEFKRNVLVHGLISMPVTW
ncbi:MAG: cytochrome P450 [Rhodobiaceae bacterium]|nr:cytochrome P450 [Rhodobiaceae bacterium]MCC0056630.1 cytochrome P450 [Rhodobiaceae bacterium]